MRKFTKYPSNYVRANTYEEMDDDVLEGDSLTDEQKSEHAKRAKNLSNEDLLDRYSDILMSGDSMAKSNKQIYEIFYKEILNRMK
jgi:hypothetical protein